MAFRRPSQVLERRAFAATCLMVSIRGMCSEMSSSLSVADCVFSNNLAQSNGGGMSNDSCEGMISDCTFEGNTANAQGGGIYDNLSSPAVVRCLFKGNLGNVGGGGIDNWGLSSPAINDCIFTGNLGFNGAGISNRAQSSPALTNCVFGGNLAYFGGAIYNDISSPVVTNSTLTGNRAITSGGGVYDNDSNPTISNCILWGDGTEIVDAGTSAATVDYSDIEGGWAGAGTGNINADPKFVGYGSWDDSGTPADPLDDIWTDGDYHLQAGSPCIDAADGDVAPGTDLGADSRVDDPATSNTGVGTPPYADMGAHEYQP